LELDPADTGVRKRIQESIKSLDAFPKIFFFFMGWKIAANAGVLWQKFIDWFIKEECKMNASVAIQVLPNVTDDEEVIRIVDEVIAYIKSFGLSTYVGPFETTIEGDYDRLMEIVAGCQKVAMAAGGCDQVSTYVKIVYKPEGEVLTIERKVSKHH